MLSKLGFNHILGNGAIEFEEFCASFQTYMALPSADDLETVFKTLDKNGDGYLTKDEIKAALCDTGEPMSDEGVNEMLSAADVNQDGKVSYKGKDQTTNPWTKST